MVQLAQNLVRNFFAIVLDGFDDLDLLRHSGVVGQHLREGLRAGNNVSAMFLEQDEELPSRGINRWKNPGMATRSP